MRVQDVFCTAFFTLDLLELALWFWNKNVRLFQCATNSSFRSLIPFLLNFFLHCGQLKMRVCFFVVFAGFASFGNFCPPYPFLSSSCRRSPIAEPLLFPALYKETFCRVCVLHLGQYLLTSFGIFIDEQHIAR